MVSNFYVWELFSYVQGLVILTFGGSRFLRFGVSKSYAWGLLFLRLEVTDSHVLGLVILTFGG